MVVLIKISLFVATFFIVNHDSIIDVSGKWVPPCVRVARSPSGSVEFTSEECNCTNEGSSSNSYILLPYSMIKTQRINGSAAQELLNAIEDALESIESEECSSESEDIDSNSSSDECEDPALKFDCEENSSDVDSHSAENSLGNDNSGEDDFSCEESDSDSDESDSDSDGSDSDSDENESNSDESDSHSEENDSHPKENDSHSEEDGSHPEVDPNYNETDIKLKTNELWKELRETNLFNNIILLNLSPNLDKIAYSTENAIKKVDDEDPSPSIDAQQDILKFILKNMEILQENLVKLLNSDNQAKIIPIEANI